MPLTKAPAKIVDKGGNILINVVLPNGAMPTISSSNTHDLGAMTQSAVAQTASKSVIKSEDGEAQVTSFEYEGGTTATLMQTDKELIDYLGDAVKDVQVLEIKYTGVNNGKDQWVFRVGQVTPQFNISRPNGASSNVYEFTTQNLASDFTISAANLLAIAATLTISTVSFFPTTTVTISASKSFEVVEVA